MKKSLEGQGIEAIAVKRAAVVDSDKVRYRVYRSADDFVAVIAESALLAMRVSGIDKPYRIVRDLPTEGISIEAQRLHQLDDEPRVMLNATFKTKPDEAFKTEMPKPGSQKSPEFVPMQVKDFERKKTPWTRILTANMVDPVAAAPAAPPKAAPPMAKVIPPEPVEPIVEPPLAETAAPLPAEPEPAAEAAPPAVESDTLSEEEVQRLLNG